MEEKNIIDNKESCEKISKVFNFFSRYVKEEGGRVKVEQTTPDRLELIVLVDSIDFYKDYMKEFVACLPLIEQMKIINIGDDSVEIRITA